MFAIVDFLKGPAAARLIDGALHGVGHAIGVKNRLASGIPGSAANRLNQRLFGTEKAFFVGVQNCDQRHLGQVQSLPQQVNANQASTRRDVNRAES